MRILIFILIGTLLSFSNCATKRKTKVAEKLEVKTENVIQNDSVFQLKSKVSKIETYKAFNEFESVLKALNVQYDGEQANELNITLNRTENGTELNVKGKGKANYNEQTEKTKSLTRNDVVNILDSIIDARIEQNKHERSQQLVYSFKSDTEKEKTDISFWVYVVISVIVSLVIFFTWLNSQINKLNKMGGK